MTTIASQITSLTVVYSTVYSDADQRKHQSSASLAFVWVIHRDRWISRTKGQLRGKCFHLMTSSWSPQQVTSITWANIGHDVWHYMVPLGHNELKIFLRICLNGQKPLTHWGRDKMAAISQTMCSNAFSWMEIYEFRLKFHWNLFLRVYLTIFQNWFR